jgi:hypothetical protein
MGLTMYDCAQSLSFTFEKMLRFSDLAAVLRIIAPAVGQAMEASIKECGTAIADERDGGQNQQSRQIRSFLSMASSSTDLVPRFSWIRGGTSFALGCR